MLVEALENCKLLLRTGGIARTPKRLAKAIVRVSKVWTDLQGVRLLFDGRAVIALAGIDLPKLKIGVGILRTKPDGGLEQRYYLSQLRRILLLRVATPEA